MKQTVNEHDFRRAFETLRPENFTYEALGLLFEWFEEYEECTEQETELDVIAICCDWSESDAEELMRDYGISLDTLGLDADADEEEISEALMEYVTERTMVAGITSDGGIVYCSW